MQKKIFEILVLTALIVGLIWTILELTPKSALLSLTILYLTLKPNFAKDNFNSAAFIAFKIKYGLDKILMALI